MSGKINSWHMDKIEMQPYDIWFQLSKYLFRNLYQITWSQYHFKHNLFMRCTAPHKKKIHT